MARLKGWRTLAAAWAAVFVLAAGLAVVLQVLGPPPPQARASEVATASPPPPNATPAAPTPIAPAPAASTPAASTPAASMPEPVAPPAAQTVASNTPASTGIPEPQPALLEPAPDFSGAQLPRIAPDGRSSMRVYARGYDLADRRPRVAMVVVGFGLSTNDSMAALTMLPRAITIGISPYTNERTAMPEAARAAGHEFLVTLPMESQGYPLNDSGPRGMLTEAEPADNDRNLEWTLSRIQGEVGVTGASDGLLGERYAASNSTWDAVRAQLAARGLLYVDPRPGVTVSGPAVDVSVVVDDPPERDMIDAKLARLEQMARDRGVAIGLAERVRPVTIERITAWARALDGRGINLVPVSALIPAAAAAPPATPSKP